MKTYKKRYEDVYSHPLKLKKCIVSEISTDIGMNGYEYIDAMKKLNVYAEKTYLDILIKRFWMARRFFYKGEQRLKYFQNGHALEASFGVLNKHYVGCSREIFSSKSVYRILTYFKDFFPDMDEKNPFEEKFEFPYKHIGLSYLCVVYQMGERLEFLDYAEKNKLRYTEFLDYMINHVYCANEESAKPVYAWQFTAMNFPYVSVISKKARRRNDIIMSKKDEKFTKQRKKINTAKRAAAVAKRRADWTAAKRKQYNVE